MPGKREEGKNRTTGRPKLDGRSAAGGRKSVRRRIGGLGTGRSVREARVAQGLSQYQVARLTDGRVSRTTLGDIECGRSLPGLEVLVALSKVLHFDPREILERVDVSSATPVDMTETSVDALKQRAKEFFWAGDYRGALAVYDAVADRLALDEGESEERNLDLAKLEVNRAVTLRQLSALRAAEAAAKRATELAEGIPEIQVEACMVLASLHSHEGHLFLAGIAADQAVALSRELPAKLRGQAWNQKGNVLFRAERYQQARQAFLRARKCALEAEETHDLISTEGNIGTCLGMLGRHEQGRARLTKAIELARKVGDRGAEAFWLVELGDLALREGKFDDADRYAVAALGIAKPAERTLTVFRAEWLRHAILREQGRGATDTKRLQELKRLYGRVRDHRGLGVIREYEKAMREATSAEEEDKGDD